MTVKFGLVGYGAWGRCHAQSIEQVEGATLVAVSARSEQTLAQARQDRGGVSTHSNYRDLVQRDDVDVVDIVVPSHLHAEIATAALDAGKHVLLEKPMAITVEDCDRIIEAARRSRKILYMGHELRLSPLWAGVKELIATGSIGTPRHGHIDLWRRPYRKGSEGWRYDPTKVGSWLLEEPIHFFDLARWYMADVGEPQTVYAHSNAKSAAGSRLHDNQVTVLTFPESSHVLISHTTAAFDYRMTIRFTGTEGALEARWFGALDRDAKGVYELTWFDGEEVHQVPIQEPAGEVYELTKEIQAMVECVTEGKPPLVSGADGREAVRLCLAAGTSTETNSVVNLA